MASHSADISSPESDPPNMSGLRIVLLGKNVSENSRVGNIILGTEAFHSEAHSSYSQQHSVRISGTVEKRKITVINTYHLLHPHLSLHQITQRVRECVSLSAPGPHVILLVLQFNDFSDEDMRRVKTVLNLFSEKAIKHTIVVTTDEETYTSTSKIWNKSIHNLIKECGGKQLKIDIRNPGWRSEMIRRTEEMLTEEHEEFLICNMYEDGGSSVDGDLSRSGGSVQEDKEEEDSDLNEDGKLNKNKKNRSDAGVCTREQIPERVPQNMNTSGKAKLNIVLCGFNTTFKNSVSEMFREIMSKPQKEMSNVCVKKEEKINGRQITVIELPALSQLSEEEVMRETLHCLNLCDPGVHAFILVISDYFTNEDKAEMEKIHRMFSSNIKNNIMILIKQNSEESTAELNEETQSVIESFGGRHHFIGPKTQASMLMEKLKQVVEENNDVCFSKETFLEVQMEKLLKFEEMKRKIHSLQTWFQSQDSRERADDLRIVLLGKTGVGKSSTGNTILGRNILTSESSPKSVTKVCKSESAEINGRHVTVIDTPGLFDTDLSNEEIKREISNCISMILPGPHVFLIVLNLGQRFTQEEAKAVKIIQETFGDKSLMFTIVLFTRGDDLKNKPIEQWLGNPGSSLKKLIEECGNRYHVFNNNQTGDRTQVSDLLKKIDDMVKENGDSYYSCKMFREMEREIQEQQKMMLMDRMDQMKREKEELMNKNEEEKKRREEEFREREQQYKRDIKEREEKERTMREQMNREREECERKKKEERQKRDVEDEKRRKKEQEINDEYNQKLKQEEERMMMMLEKERQNHDQYIKRREKEFRAKEERYKTELESERQEWDKQKERRKKIDQETWDEYYQRLKREIEKIDGEREILKSKHKLEKERIKRMMEEKRQAHEKERKRRDEENIEREEQYKRDIEDMEEQERKIQEEMKREREEWEKQKQQREAEEKEALRYNNHPIGSPEDQLTNNEEDSASDPECLRILLFGRTGNGKSATGNTILGNDEFHSEDSLQLVTTLCEKGVGEVDGKSVAVVDTPGLFDTTLTKEQVMEEMMNCVSLSAPGPHVFIIVLRLGRITQEEKYTLDTIKMIFGPKAADFSIVLFTRADELKEQTIEQYVEKSGNAELKKLISDWGNRFLAFNNRETQDRAQVTQLFNMIEDLNESNEGRFFTNEMFEEAAISTEQRREMIEENERKNLNQVEELEAKYDTEIKHMTIRLEEKKQKTEEERERLENKFREKEETLRREFEEKEEYEQKKREKEDQKQSEEEKQQRTEYDQRINEMEREIEKQQKEREEEDRKREEEYEQYQEKMKMEQENIMEETKKEDSGEQMRKKEEEKEREEWKIKIKDAENDKEIQEKIKQQLREWEEKKKREMRERKEKGVEIEKIRKREEEEGQMIKKEREKKKREREEKDREYEEERNEIKRHYEKLEQERKEEWERRKREDEERQKEKRKRWEKMMEDLKQAQEEEIKRREREGRDGIDKEEKACDEMKQKYKEQIEKMKQKHQDESGKQEEELNKFSRRKEKHIQEFKHRLAEFQKQLNEMQKLRKEVNEKWSCLVM